MVDVYQFGGPSISSPIQFITWLWRNQKLVLAFFLGLGGLAWTLTNFAAMQLMTVLVNLTTNEVCLRICNMYDNRCRRKMASNITIFTWANTLRIHLIMECGKISWSFWDFLQKRQIISVCLKWKRRHNSLTWVHLVIMIITVAANMATVMTTVIIIMGTVMMNTHISNYKPMLIQMFHIAKYQQWQCIWEHRTDTEFQHNKLFLHRWVHLINHSSKILSAFVLQSHVMFRTQSNTCTENVFDACALFEQCIDYWSARWNYWCLQQIT